MVCLNVINLFGFCEHIYIYLYISFVVWETRIQLIFLCIGNDPAPEKIAKSKDKKKNRKTSDSLDQGDEQVCTEELKKTEQLEEADKNGKAKTRKTCKIVSNTSSDALEQRQLEPLSVKGKGASDSGTEKKSKDKKKNKNKSNDDSVNPNVEQGGVEAKQVANGTSESIAGVDVKPKGKKKKKESSGGEDKKVVAMGDASETVLKKEDFKISDADATDNKENKGSKKRKRLDSERNDSEPANSKEDEESKRRKVEALKESKGSAQPAISDAPLGIAEQLNENLDKSAEKSSVQKSMKKQRNGSTEVIP